MGAHLIDPGSVLQHIQTVRFTWSRLLNMHQITNAFARTTHTHTHTRGVNLIINNQALSSKIGLRVKRLLETIQTAQGDQLTTEPTRIANLSLILPHIT